RERSSAGAVPGVDDPGPQAPLRNRTRQPLPRPQCSPIPQRIGCLARLAEGLSVAAAEQPEHQLRGEVVYLYAFDVANGIPLDRASDLLSGRATPCTVRLDRPTPRDIPMSAPLAVEPPVTATQVNGSPAKLLVRLYEVGVISVTVRVAFASDSLAALR